ncbi:hypothetical protein OOU_Y34scaffold00566g6 [Pyricularia oryzae Y34]|uniref:Uncharacterized protein n=1 Tax=Pyricularia oryzae (strain Y34) TaxID=1143189 RepID=A0AA97NX14_PYRO3|nr:hypothetical protein OOU_Y34scaffold00566g6 [Pyricularia oryzae Y34]
MAHVSKRPTLHFETWLHPALALSQALASWSRQLSYLEYVLQKKNVPRDVGLAFSKNETHYAKPRQTLADGWRMLRGMYIRASSGSPRHQVEARNEAGPWKCQIWKKGWLGSTATSAMSVGLRCPQCLVDCNGYRGKCFFFVRQAVGIPRHEPLAGFSIRGEMVQSLEKKRRQMQSWPAHKEVSQGARIIIDKYHHHSLASTSSITHVSTEQENQVENKPVFPSQISIMATRQQQWQPGSWYCCQCNGSKTNPPNIPETNTCAMCHANGSHHIKCSDCSAV